jgi:hypothetical protein
MIVRTSLLLVAGLTLGSCASVLGTSTAGVPVASAPTASVPVVSAPTANVTSSAPDGLASAPDDEPQADAPAKPRKTARRRDIDVEPLGDSSASARRRRGDSYEEQQAADLADEARLKRKLIICQNCSSSGN